MSLLDVRNVETYYGPIMAIRGVSMSVEEGKSSKRSQGSSAAGTSPGICSR